MTSPSHSSRSRSLVTGALIASGSVLAASGLTMLAGGLGVPIGYKLWALIGVSNRAVGTVHQVAAVGFLGSAGVHIAQRRRVVARHLREIGRGPAHPAREHETESQALAASRAT